MINSTEDNILEPLYTKNHSEIYKHKTQLSNFNDCKYLRDLRIINKKLVLILNFPNNKTNISNIKTIFNKYGNIRFINTVELNIDDLSKNLSNKRKQCNYLYVEYFNVNNAINAIKNINNSKICDVIIKATLGTSKFCKLYLNYKYCNNKDCKYIHYIPEEEDCFKKRELVSTTTICITYYLTF